MKNGVYKNEKRQIYIEIDSRRQIGKTTRLVEDIFNYILNTDENVAFLGNYHHFYNIRERLFQYKIDKKLTFDIGKIKLISDMQHVHNSVRIYIDEFISLIDTKDLYLRNNMYITSSPMENPESSFIKKIQNITNWRRKQIIDKLLDDNQES